jgi:hypothetical protein
MDAPVAAAQLRVLHVLREHAGAAVLREDASGGDAPEADAGTEAHAAGQHLLFGGVDGGALEHEEEVYACGRRRVRSSARETLTTRNSAAAACA